MKSPGLKHPGRWIWLLLLVPIVIGFSRLRLDVEMLHLLPRQLRPVEGLLLYQEHFGNSSELVITIGGPGAEVVQQATDVLGEALRNTTGLVSNVSWKPPWMETPGQMSEIIAFAWLNQTPEAFQVLAKRLAPEHAEVHLTQIKEELATSLSPQALARLTYDPFGVTDLPEELTGSPALPGSEAGFGYGTDRLRVMFVKSAGDLETYDECAVWLRSIQDHVQAALIANRLLDEVEIGFTGRPAFVAEIAKGMERDMRRSVIGAALLVGGIFWLAHRRLKPLIWLLILLALVLASTLGLGGLLFGEVNVISMGFAAILVGLGVDYAVVQYHQHLARPGCSVAEIRGLVGRSIFGAAMTTIIAFLSLTFFGLPGLAQLGTLVAIGVALAAAVFLLEFLPPLVGPPVPAENSVAVSNSVPGQRPVSKDPWAVVATLAVLGTCLAVLLGRGLPELDASAQPLRPRNSQAYAALDQMQQALGQEEDPLWLLAGGTNEWEVAEQLTKVSGILQRAKAEGLISGFVVPSSLWPNPGNQEANKRSVEKIIEDQPALERLAREQGFTEEALALFLNVVSTWKQAMQEADVFWPKQPASRNILSQFTARPGTNYYAVALVKQPKADQKQALAALQQMLPAKDVWLTGWSLLGNAVFQHVKERSWIVLPTILALATASLWITFGRIREVLLSLSVLVTSGLCLLTLMTMLDWKWNLMNMMAIPLIVGTGVDYSIFMQLNLRRTKGQRKSRFTHVEKALLLCGSTSMAGFGTLGFSSNAGIASLGPLCALGIGLNMLLGLLLLPRWWQRWESQAVEPLVKEGPAKPSLLYRSGIWSLALSLTRLLPNRLLNGLGAFVAMLYRNVARKRSTIVVQNLLPVFGEHEPSARKAARETFRAFSRKLIHLWQFERGLAVRDLLRDHSGWDHFENAYRAERGVLLVTIHLGNWELGAAWLADKGIRLSVITLEEPGAGFTQQREAARARWGVSTVVIGNDPFGSLEIIRRLGQGETVALLMDRPPDRTAVELELFGRPFRASIAAAEIARATGCAVLPVYIIAEGGGYSAHILPPLQYDRPGLRNQEARKRFTQQILRAFEPVIREHPSQWYHFVPVWQTGNRRSKE